MWGEIAVLNKCAKLGLAISSGPILFFSYGLYQSLRLVFIAKPVHKWIEDRTWLMTKVWVGSYLQC